MATVTGLTAARMQEIEAQSVVEGEVRGDDLILTKHDGSEINAGHVVGPAGPVGPQGPPAISSIPGEIKLWPSANLPDPAKYGTWAWANGAIFNDSDHPEAAANISPSWKTAMGASDPGPGKSRVPDLRGVVPAGLDAMPVGSARANRMTRASALTQAGKTGEETHVISVGEMPSHNHGAVTGTDSPDHAHSGTTGGESADHVHTVPGHTHNLPIEYKASFAANSSSICVTNVDGKTGASAGQQATAVTDPSTPFGTSGRSTGHVHAFSTGGASARHAHSIPAQGGSAGHENIQPTVMVPYIVFLGV